MATRPPAGWQRDRQEGAGVRKPAQDRVLATARRGIEALRTAALKAAHAHAAELGAACPAFRDGAVNLAHYLGVRRHDIRDLQGVLGRLGLSSLGRMESQVLPSLDAVRAVLAKLCGAPVDAGTRDAFAAGRALLEANADAMLGPPRPDRPARIMVTLSTEAARDPDVVRDLMRNGMDIARINCAHDDAAAWGRMVGNIRRAERALRRRCRISFDLAGPKLRTGPLAPGPQVLKVRPARDSLGRVLAPLRVRFAASPSDAAGDGVRIPLTADLARHARAGDALAFTDARGRRREYPVVAVAGGDCLCDAGATAYVVPDIAVELRRKGRRIAGARVAALPSIEQPILLRPGDVLEIFRGSEPGTEAVRDARGRIRRAARVGCALPEVFAGVRAGERIFIDDGRIGGVIRKVSRDRLEVAIASAAGGVAKLRGEKGINLPDSALALAALTDKDVADLAFVARHGDMVAMSFVQRPEDVARLLEEMRRADGMHLGIVLKIETRCAFEGLPRLLFAAMRHAPLAVMVARGDLGVEVGFERLSEVQEEILWFSEAAHVPVIWATQVLESLAKGGLPTRGEVTDAAMSGRAECVMLNKGPYINEALRFLVDVLERMTAHQSKKSALLRKLHVSELDALPVAPRPARGRRAARRIRP